VRLLLTIAVCGASFALGAEPNLRTCPHNPSALCGTLWRPLDPAGQVGGTIQIAFEFYPARDGSQPALGTIVAVEGGPGYATTASAGGYLGLFAPLLDRRNMLLVDNRGTGGSQAIDCEPLQSELVQTVADAGACGTELGKESDLYGTALATDDLAAVIRTLAAGPVDLYGDSYGTWFSQAFAVNHPDLVRAVILDSAYPVRGENPFYPFAGVFNRRNYNLVCERSLSCAGLAGTSQDRIETLVRTLRAHPFTGHAHDGNGQFRQVTADAVAVAYAEYGGVMGEVIYRELDPAARAYLNDGDSAPLLRIFAENNLMGGFDQPGGPPRQYSRGLFAAVSCSDYPQLYNMTSPPALRVFEEQAAISREQAGVYAPFTIDEFRKTSIDVGVLDLCLDWPVPSPAHPPQHSIPPNAKFPKVPVLVLSGELDSLTTPTEGRLAADLFPNSRQVLVANSFHVTAAGDPDHCASVIANRFFLDLSPGDTSCASKISEVRTVPTFAVTAAQVQPAAALAGNRGTTDDLRVAAAATLAAGDMIARWWVNTSGFGAGLRGGTFQYTSVGNLYHYGLSGIRWTNDVEVSGWIYWDYGTGSVTANLSVTGPRTSSGSLIAAWDDRQPHAAASISGQLGGRDIYATMYAP
jgi:pimeloyl-ACP methyl ester carboxylesterase